MNPYVNIILMPVLVLEFKLLQMTIIRAYFDAQSPFSKGVQIT